MRFARRFGLGRVAFPWVLLIAVLANAWRPPPLPRSFRELSSEEISSLVKVKDPLKNLDPNDPDSHLSKILIPRSPDTANNTQVRNYIVNTLKKLNWYVEEDTFTGQTPYGIKAFTNVIATKDPKASRRVVVAAHFDSKFFPSYPENQFVGATDSAMPCALMLDLAEVLDPLLDSRFERLENGLEDDVDVSETTLQLVFFDGEEAFKDWTPTDSIYGARHLAEKWSTSYINHHSKRRLLRDPSPTELSTIEHLILLDLLGASHPLIQSSFPETGWLFDEMLGAETKLGKRGHLTGPALAVDRYYSFFKKRSGHETAFGYIGDDHVPFLSRGVSVLHVISNPFPRVWHKLSDDATALDSSTMRQWNLIMRVFLAGYLNLMPEPIPHVERSHEELVRSALR
ncbi:hypothetical protein BDM02DRAFT_3087680 [Thelephora ganbajun]|uniref:Uncharacterized protein n=1 Tax=Thelephora ganbajun TaxID=370292 RepID=A0ACB6ZTZ8_THEGA|nr:hypothetical protein BDM02DRAFT_3087680 [Thelephora ganbajun]